MKALIRPFGDRDAGAVVDLWLRAWAPVFASIEQVLGSAIFRRLHPNWREDQRRAVEDVCAAQKGPVWVAEVDGAAVGFVAVELHPGPQHGRDLHAGRRPRAPGRRHRHRLTEFALDRLKDAGMKVAMVETGGDPGHAAARHTYEKAGFVLSPVARYFKNL